MYIYDREDWPNFFWNNDELIGKLAALRFKQGQLLGRMGSLGFRLQSEATLETITEEVVKSSQIEGELLDTTLVRSSVARQLGIALGAIPPPDRYIDGIVEMVLDATQRCDDPLTRERLFGWHSALFPGGRSGMSRIIVGDFRNDQSGPMQVVSGPVGKQHVHFQAPPAVTINTEIEAFLDWYNRGSTADPLLKTAIAHLWFVTIHPFDDGNGRIARAIADQALTRSEKGAQRFYSMAAQIRKDREAYYNILETTQKGDLNITPWIKWFLGCLESAIDGAQTALAGTLRKAGFWQKHSDKSLNVRQRSILNRLLDGFEGKLTSSKYAKIAKCSQDTALRDIDDLIRQDILTKNRAGGRSASYSIIETEPIP